MATQADFARIGNYARMYNTDQNRDPRNRHRTVHMEVLSLGFSRTGTLSMRQALEILGYPDPYHFSSCYDNTNDCEVWMDLIDAKFNGKGDPDILSKSTFDGLLGHCGAVTDMPCTLFAAELIKHYPDAKIVLVERDIDSWFKSWSAFLDNAFPSSLPILGMMDPNWGGRIIKLGTTIVPIQTGGATDVASAKARSKEEYRKHYALIRSLVPKERILEYRLGSGWGPLCGFLGKNIPEGDFPRLNDTVSNTRAFKELALLCLQHFKSRIVHATTFVAVPGIAVAATAYWWTRICR